MVQLLWKEKLKYNVTRTVYEIRSTFMQFSPFGRILFIVFLLGCIPAYYGAKYIAIGAFAATYSGVRVQAQQANILASDLEVGTPEIFSVGIGTFSAIASVYNPNLDISVGATGFTAIFYDGSGRNLGSKDGIFFLKPNSRTNLIIPRFDSAQTRPTRVEFTLKDPAFQKRITTAEIDLSTPVPLIYNQSDPLAFVVEGSMLNNSPYSIKTVVIKYILFDKQNKMLGVSSREEYTLAPFERRAYKQIWPGIYSDNVSRVEVKAETNVFDAENLRIQ